MLKYMQILPYLAYMYLYLRHILLHLLQLYRLPYGGKFSYGANFQKFCTILTLKYVVNMAIALVEDVLPNP